MSDAMTPEQHGSPVTPRRAMLAGMAGIAAGALLTRGAKAGPLDPPAGPVASTGKTLTEVEPRIAISETNTPGNAASVFRITQPGSYYLTGNVVGEPGKSGISIESSNVTLDLNGFAVIGIAGAVNGIRTVGVRNNLTVRNGAVSDWPSAGLTFSAGGSGLNARVEGVIANNNGANGLTLSGNTIVRGCIAENNGGNGISLAANGVIVDCAVRNNNGSGITSGFGVTISGCSVRDNTIFGIASGESSVVQECSVRGSGSTGISLASGSTAQGCSSTNNGLHGIFASSRCYVRGNTCSFNGSGGTGSGIRASNSENRIEENHCAGNEIGIEAISIANFIVRNTCRANSSLNYAIANGNVCLVIPATISGGFAGNNGGASPGSTNPSTNYAI